jgi:glycosyltransferase involved in cell wall biosynthesis
MRVLLSAYACEPGKGSEPEVGWQRALHTLASADEVWVLTRSNNQTVIEADPHSHAPGLHFLYCDLSPWLRNLKKKAWFLPFYFILWQWKAYQLAAECHRETPFDRVYHVTFAGMQSGSFMGRLGIPFVIGPIAGGERAPFRLRRSMPLRCKVSECLRDLRILLQRVSPVARPAYSAAEHIFVATADSLRLIPHKWRSKASVCLAIAAPDRAERPDKPKRAGLPRFVYAGRLLHWKGAHFAIRALAEARKALPAATLTLIGSGPDEQWLRDLACRYEVEDAVEFAGQLPRDQLVDSLRGYTAFVYPSLHDSGGFTVLESLQEGTPVICFDLGGPGILVNPSCGVVVPTKDADEDLAITRIAAAMLSLGTMAEAEWERLSMAARSRADELSWASLTQLIAQG